RSLRSRLLDRASRIDGIVIGVAAFLTQLPSQAETPGALRWRGVRNLRFQCLSGLATRRDEAGTPEGVVVSSNEELGFVFPVAVSRTMELLFALLPYYLCMLAGLIMIGAGIWLLAKGKIILDAKTGEPVFEAELPWKTKVKTNTPALAFFVLGFVPLI